MGGPTATGGGRGPTPALWAAAASARPLDYTYGDAPPVAPAERSPGRPYVRQAPAGKSAQPVMPSGRRPAPPAAALHLTGRRRADGIGAASPTNRSGFRSNADAREHDVPVRGPGPAGRGPLPG